MTQSERESANRRRFERFESGLNDVRVSREEHDEFSCFRFGGEGRNVELGAFRVSGENEFRCVLAFNRRESDVSVLKVWTCEGFESDEYKGSRTNSIEREETHLYLLRKKSSFPI